MQRWIQFSKERFDPLSHVLLLVVFIGVHVLYSLEMGAPFSIVKASLAFLAALVFFFKLRLYDEIKDYDTDLKINPHRPLPRGLVSHQDLHRGIIVCLFAFILFMTLADFRAFFASVFSVCYGLLMFKEFFLGERLKRHLTTYAMTHTFVTVLLSLSLLSALKGEFPWPVNFSDLSFALASWCYFNIFEFGRKTYLVNEERRGVDTYSSLFGKWGAFGLSFTQALIGTTFLSMAIEQSSFLIWIPLALLFLLGLPYLFKTSGNAGRTYRMGTSLYIIVAYIMAAIELI